MVRRRCKPPFAVACAAEDVCALRWQNFDRRVSIDPVSFADTRPDTEPVVQVPRGRPVGVKRVKRERHLESPHPQCLTPSPFLSSSGHHASVEGRECEGRWDNQIPPAARRILQGGTRPFSRKTPCCFLCPGGLQANACRLLNGLPVDFDQVTAASATKSPHACIWAVLGG